MNQVKPIALLLVALFLVSTLRAQTARITGKVWNTEANAPLAGASVVLTDKDAVAGSRRGASTDVEGRFFLAAFKGHVYTLTITGVGFVTRTIENIAVGDDPVSIDITMQGSRKSLEQVVVSANVRKATVASLYSIQKNSSAISDGISADVIRRSPDKSTGDVLKRVSGASIQDNKFVVIRGMNERYNVALMNSSVLPSTEPDKKGFAFNIIPSALVDNLVIYKASTPDLPGDFAGGAIKVQTKDYPAQPLSELSVSMGYNTKTTGKNFYKGQPDGDLDWLGFLDRSRLIPRPYYRDQANFISKSPDFKMATTKLFSNTFDYRAVQKSIPSISASYTGGNTKLYNNGHKLGFIYSVGYSNGRNVSDRIRDEFDRTRQFLYHYTSNNYDEKNNLSGLLSLAYSYGGSKISWKTLFYNEFMKTIAPRTGLNDVNNTDTLYYKALNNEVTQNGLLNSVVEGQHALNKGWSLNWSGSYGYTYRNQPDQKIISFRTPYNQPAPYFLQLSNENSPAIRTAGRVYSFLQENIYNGNINVGKRFELWGLSQKFQFGTLNYYRDRKVEVAALGYASLKSGGDTIELGKGSTYNDAFTSESIDRHQITVANIGLNSTNYTANALLNAGYVMLDNKFSDKWKLVWGVRVERYHQKLQAVNKARVDKDNTDVLPSVLLTYALDPKTNLRLSGSRSVNRPEFRELAEYAVYDYDNYFNILGNSALKRSQNTNADLRYEFFPQAGEIISVSAFYKYFKDPIEQVNLRNDNLSYDNAQNAYVYGAELELRKKLDFIGSSFFNHLTAYANAAYIKGGVKFDNGVSVKNPMQGQSPYLINAGLTYVADNEDWSVNLLYNRIGPRLRFRGSYGASLSIYEKPRDVLDAQLTKKLFGGKAELKLTVSDILAQAFVWYYKIDENDTRVGFDPKSDKIIVSNKFGTTATLGLRVNLGR
ncbi:MAG: TonB-dependent receptor [Bacteroidetes bacterium]|nr:TonB-dependent receptor [Bacteroidota bacterium]